MRLLCGILGIERMPFAIRGFQTCAASARTACQQRTPGMDVLAEAGGNFRAAVAIDLKLFVSKPGSERLVVGNRLVAVTGQHAIPMLEPSVPIPTSFG